MIYTKTYEAPLWNEREILRYAGAKALSSQEQTLLHNCLAEVQNKFNYKVCWCRFPVRFMEAGLDLTFAQTNSKGLMKNLEGCQEILLFAATIGLEIDRLIHKYSRLSPAKALFFQAIGAERIESLCDAFCKDLETHLQAEGKHLKPRFSPGYGDLPLTLQEDIFRVLDCSRKIGLTLNSSLLMSPSKSVTAIVGISQETPIKIHLNKG